MKLEVLQWILEEIVVALLKHRDMFWCSIVWVIFILCYFVFLLWAHSTYTQKKSLSQGINFLGNIKKINRSIMELQMKVSNKEI